MTIVPASAALDRALALGHRMQAAFRVSFLVDWKAYQEELAQQLMLIPEPAMLQDDMQFQHAVTSLTTVIQATTDTVVPLLQMLPAHEKSGPSYLHFMSACAEI